VSLYALIVRSSDPTGLLLWCGIGFCTGIGLFFYGFRLLQRRRLILDTPFSKIRSASIGMVEVSGLAVGPYTMVAPITARPCYYYRTLVWEFKQSGKNKQWVKVAGECMHVPFFVDDNTGRVLVDPRGADLDLHCDFEEQFCDSFFTTKDPAPNNVRSFLGRHGIVTNNKIKVQEFCIKPKNSLFILGTLGENPGLDVSPQPAQDHEILSSSSSAAFSMSIGSVSLSMRGGFGNQSIDFPADGVIIRSDHQSRQVIRLTPENATDAASEMTQQKRIASALLKAGISNPAAWSAAGVPAAGMSDTGLTNPAVQVLADSTATVAGETSVAFDLHPPVVLMKGTNNKTFLISWRSQQEVARSLGWKCALMIWGGPALALLCLYFFLGIEQLR
jgi:E3 ubiquitin ligase